MKRKKQRVENQAREKPMSKNIEKKKIKGGKRIKKEKEKTMTF